MKISRRSFILGGGASLFGAGLVLGGCHHKIGDKETGNTDSIKASLVYSFEKFDYVGTVNPSIAAIGWHIFEGLYNINPINNEVYAALAKNRPERIDDLTYEVELRDDAKFSNNAKVMAGDVTNSFSAAKSKDSINFMLDFIDKVEAVGSNKVRFHLNVPIVGLLEERLSLVKIVPANGSEVENQKNPIGTGPYAITEMDGNIGGLIKFMPNTNYNGRLEMPKDPMVWTITTEENARCGAIKGGASYVSEDILPSKVYELRDDGNNVEFVEGFENAFFFFKTTKSPFDNKEVRQAIYYALDTERLINEQLYGHGSPSTSFLSTTNKYYHAASTIYSYNPDKAKELLYKYGVTGKTINFAIDKNSWAYSFKDTIIENLEKVGLKCNIYETEFKWTDIEKKLKNFDFDLCMSTIDRSLHGANADFLLRCIYYNGPYMETRTEYPYSKGNRFNEIKELIDKSVVAASNEKQKVYNEIFNIIADEVPLYPFIHKEQITAFDSKKIAGFSPISTGGLYLLGTTLNK